MKEVNESILKKIKGLLAIANDNENDQESQSALLMAQRLMAKHKIEMSSIEGSTKKKEMANVAATSPKRLYWWEKQLGNIIADNFRVTMYYQARTVYKKKQSQTAIHFFGYEEDLELAVEMYALAKDAILVYSKRFIDNYYTGCSTRIYAVTNEVKNSYMLGFLEGLKEKFENQVALLRKEYSVMVLVPQEVKDEFKLMTEGWGSVTFDAPNIERMEAYSVGYSEGNSIDYTRSTIDDKVVVSN